MKRGLSILLIRQPVRHNSYQEEDLSSNLKSTSTANSTVPSKMDLAENNAMDTTYTESQNINSNSTENQKLWSLEDEHRKNKNLRKGDIDDLKKFCSGLPDVDISTIPDNLIVALLHSSTYDMVKARHTATKYFELRFSSLEVFENRDVDSEPVKTALEVGCCCPLPRKTPDGYRILLVSLRNSDASLYDYVALTKVQSLTIDACVQEDPTCPGYIFIGDMRGFTMSHIWKSTFSTMKKLMRFSKEGAALKIHQFIALNSSTFTYYVMKLTSPFIPKHLYDSFLFYTSEQMDEFWKVVPREYMPEDYGGHLPKLDILCQEQTDWLRKMRPDVEFLPMKSK